MHRHDHHQRMGHPGNDIHSAVWLIGLAVLFFTGFWWPGILVLAGISMILQWALSEANSQPMEPVRQPIASQPVQPPAAPAPIPAPVMQATPAAFVQPASYHPAQLLPSACPHCGGPVRANEVQWTGPRTAVCGYCGSALALKKV
jgi:hypothetical protein